jgi:hypothetical protein
MAREIWSCPHCQRQFTHPNQSHACGFFTAANHLANANPEVVALYDQFVVLVKNCGDVIIEATKTSIVFKTPAMIAVVHLKKQGLRAAFWLSRPVQHPRIRRIYSDSPNSYAHHITVESLDELDEQLQNWLCEAYAIALERH